MAAIDQFVRAVKEVVFKPSWRGLFYIMVLLGLVFGGLAAYERYTSAFELARIEKATSILARLQEIRSRGTLEGDQDLKRINDGLLADLDRILSTPSLTLHYGFSKWKSLAASSPWLLLGLYFIRGIYKKEEGSGLGLAAALVFATVFGGISIIIPELIWPWLNFVIYPVGHFALVFGSMVRASPKP